MPELFVDQAYVINAPKQKVWDAITKREHTDVWTNEFTQNQFHIEADWKLGGTVDWIDDTGKVRVAGKVTALKPNELLRYTVSDTASPRTLESKETDGMTFELTEKDGVTTMHFLQGDFSGMPDGKKYRDISDEMWKKTLPTVKRIAENG